MKFKLKQINICGRRVAINRVENRVKNRVYNRVWIFIAPLEIRSGRGAGKRQPVTRRCKNKS